MKELKDILKNIKTLDISGGKTTRVLSVEFDSRKVKNGSVFVAIKGVAVDGHLYISKAIDLGAKAIVYQDSNNVDEYIDIDFDIILTVCDHAFENCPYIPSENAIRLHHNFVDPSKVEGTVDEIKKAFINTRDEIKEYCFNLISTHLK